MKRMPLFSAVDITWKDLRILLKERGTLIYLILVPILFILAFGGSSGMSSEPKVDAISLAVVNLDEGSEASETLMEALNQGGAIRCEMIEENRARRDLESEKINRILTIPYQYGADLDAGRPVSLHLVNGPEANPIKSDAVYRVVSGVAADLSMETQLIKGFQQMADMQAGASQGQQVFTAEIIVEQAQSQIDRSKTEPLLGVEEVWPSHLVEDEAEFSPLNIYVPGFAVLFIFLTAQTTAQSIFEEKKLGSFRRLLAAPIGKISILLGKMAPNFITGLIQIIVLFGAGLLIFPLLGLEPMTLGKDPLGLLVVSFILLLCSSSLGILIAAVARTEGQISGLSQVVLWVFGFAAVLFAQMPSVPIIENISLAIPHFWANTAYLDLLIRGKTLADITNSIYPLAGFTIGFFAIGIWRFDFD